MFSQVWNSPPQLYDVIDQALRWTAPELLDPDQYNQEVDRVTKESDIYALAMVIVEVMSGRVPYPAYKNEAVILKIMEERRPERPTHPDMSDELWETVQGCWCADKTMRLKVEDVINCLERALDGRHDLVSLITSI